MFTFDQYDTINMRVDTVRGQNYKSIQDSGNVDFDDVVALVGPNEAGKTAFLQALTKFNPINREGSYNVTHEYPRINLTATEGFNRAENQYG